MKALKLISFMLICSSSLSFGQGKWINFGKEDGLASTWVRECLEDQQGNIWFSTDKGLNKFDGVRFETFTKDEGLPLNTVTKLFIDKNGIIWFTTEPPNSFAVLAGELLEALAKRGNGWGRYDGNKIVSFMNKISSEYLWSQITNVEGEIWIGGVVRKSKMGFFLIDYDGQSWNPITQLGGVNFSPISYFYVEGKDNIWFSSGDPKEDFIFHFDGSNLISYGEKDGLFSKTICKFIKMILKDRNGNLWFGSSIEGKAGGLMKFDGTSWTAFKEDDGVLGKSIDHLMEDMDGNIWVATNKAVNVFDGSTWKNYTDKDQLPGKYISIITTDSKGRVWIGTSGGLVLNDHGKWSTIDKNNGLTHNFVRSIVEDSKGNIWIGAASTWQSGGVSVYDGNTWEKPDLPKLWANDFFEDSKGNIWILTFGRGVFKYEYPD
ncbi:MAG: hypothetical protein KKG99_13905 [Bacteroidetes bacterium]|nr:hypothetical protein [Bacteroidota bacterium]